MIKALNWACTTFVAYGLYLYVSDILWVRMDRAIDEAFSDLTI